MHNLCFLLCIFSFILNGRSLSHENWINSEVLNVGEELRMETLPLQSGSRIYQLQGLKSHTWYEVKISYPASIPSCFSIQLRRSNSDMELSRKRKLLNTEKLIFKTDDLHLLRDQEEMHVLVTVEPEGVVAIPHAQEREYVIYNIAKRHGFGHAYDTDTVNHKKIAEYLHENVHEVSCPILTRHDTISEVSVLLSFSIVCDELLLGIPLKAWWVVILVLLCLGLAFVIPSFLPAYVLRTNRSPQSADPIVSKVS